MLILLIRKNIFLNKDKIIATQIPQFWLLITYSLLQSSVLALGRIFDKNSEYTLDNLINYSQKNNNKLFSKISLEARLERSNSLYLLPEFEGDEYPADQYLRDACEPTADNFRKIRKKVKKYRKIYQEKYDPIRDKVYAHRELYEDASSELFDKTNIFEIRRIAIFLSLLCEALFQQFYKGSHNIQRSDIKNFIRRHYPPKKPSSILPLHRGLPLSGKTIAIQTQYFCETLFSK